MECGTPVPPEVLEEGGLPGRSGEQSEEKPENAVENAEAAVNSEESKAEESGDVQESMPGIQPIGGNDEGTLVFCPNCGMRMQHNKEVCEKCGMKIGNKPANSVPLINNNPMDLDGSFGGFGGFSDSDINQLNSFMGGGMPSAYGNENAADNLFGTNSYSASDIEALNRQMSNFSASSSEMPAISKAKGGVRQKEPEQGEARKVEDFSMSDGSDESVPIADTSVPIIEGCSMDENPDADVSLDPYKFLGNSMDDLSEERPVDTVNLFGEPAEEAAEALGTEPVPEAVEEEAPEAVEEAPEAVEEEAPEAVEEEAPEAVEEEVPEAVEEEATEAVEEEAPEAVEEEAPEAAEEEATEAVEEEAPEAVEEEVPEAVEEEAPEAVEEEAPEAVEEEVTEAVEEEAPEAAEEALEAVEEEAPEAVEEEAPEAVEEEAPEAVEEEPVDDFIPEEMGFIAESAPVISEEVEEPAVSEAAPAAAAVTAERREVEDFDFRRPQKPQNTAPESSSGEETPKGNLVYCRTCGQDMYDTEKVCKNCGAAYKGAYVPPKFAPSNSGAKETPMIFGKIPVPKFIGGIVGIVVAAAFMLFILQPWNKKPANIVGGDTSSNASTSTSTSSESTSTTTDEVVAPSTSTETASTSTDGESTSTESSSTSEESTSTSSSVSSSSKTSTSSRPVVTPPSTDAKLKSLEQDRKKIMGAAETIAGEVGKMEMLSLNVIYAMNNSAKSNEEAINDFYESKFATSVISLLKVGKVSADRTVSLASPTNSEFSALYSSLKTLKSRYDDYYNFIISPKGGYSAFTKNCKSYYSRVTSAISGLSLDKFTSSYTAAYKNSAYKAMVSAAITDVRNSADKFATLQTQLSGLGTTFERKAFTTLTSNLTTYSEAASFAMKAKAYALMLKGVSSDYSAAASHLDSAYDNLSKLVETCSKLPKTSSDSYISSSRIAISNARSYANRAANVIK